MINYGSGIALVLAPENKLLPGSSIDLLSKIMQPCFVARSFICMTLLTGRALSWASFFCQGILCIVSIEKF